MSSINYLLRSQNTYIGIGNSGVGINTSPLTALHVSGGAIITGTTSVGSLNTLNSVITNATISNLSGISFPTIGGSGGNIVVNNINATSGSITTFNSTSITGTTITATVLNVTNAGSNFNPQFDNFQSLGTTGSRWSAVYAANGTIQTSDSHLKNYEPLVYGLDDVCQIDTIKFKWKYQEDFPEDSPERNFEYYGFKAENLRDLFSELVYDEQESEGIPIQVNYSEILPICVNSIKQLKQLNDQLRQDCNQSIAELQNEINILKTLVYQNQ